METSTTIITNLLLTIDERILKIRQHFARPLAQDLEWYALTHSDQYMHHPADYRKFNEKMVYGNKYMAAITLSYWLKINLLHVD